MGLSRVAVAVSDSRLGRALEASLVALLPEFEVERRALKDSQGEIVVTTPASCSPAECQALVDTGSRVIVISPLAQSSEQRHYEAAGAFRYLPMAIDATNEVASAVRMAALDTYSPPLLSTARLTTIIQDESPSDCS